MTKTSNPPWQEPLALIGHIAPYPHAALLHSTLGAAEDYSYLCLGSQGDITGDQLAELAGALSMNQAWHENFWVGWLGYGLKNQLETLPADTPSHIESEDMSFFQPQTIYRFDHATQQVECAGEHVLAEVWGDAPAPEKPQTIQLGTLTSNMTTPEYLAHVKTILQAIRAGTIYQADLTRKFYGNFIAEPEPLGLFQSLCRISPAAYSAYIRVDDVHVLSSSPECFLRIAADGSIETRPIKGTIKRGATPAEDEAQKQTLATSGKDQAENLMIVDLMRNDLSRVCEIGSVRVEGLFDITTHAHIHHMSSLVSGQLLPTATALCAALACFPPGSMTGAPKIKAMEICSQLEQQARGIYSGALGYFAGDGSANFSVVIRTLVMQGKKFEFGVGGGIVADSTAEAEYEETLAKAKGICTLLGIGEEEMRGV